ncbi:hypothetical protein BKA70DRAFT_1316439 [Coprinopsis sp. MPI-PUGE-AT-0042]|nr:hypothetical protein BKA70DRAFT_1331276 [Coprinopsis sp. MPI-PUGE-AT-0042]KAH6896415.1 hypothetical protein BKA70DRAFT_1316439 [Coprinopsis sp. MPI-PUGE-AT-0042]
MGKYEDPFDPEYIPDTFPTSPLTHSVLTTLTIPDDYHLLDLSDVLVFPALETFTVSNNYPSAGTRPDSMILPALQRITEHSAHLATLRLETVHLSDDGMPKLLCGLPSLKDLHITLHPAYRRGGFLSQLLEQSKIQAVLPRLTSVAVHIIGFDCSPEWLNDFDVDAFKSFAEDPRRSGSMEASELTTPERAFVFECLHRAVLKIQDEVAYFHSALM